MKGNAVINFVQISESGILKALDNVVINTGKNEGVVYTSEEVVVNSVTGSGDIKVEGGLAESLCEMADSEVGVSGNSRVRVES